MAAGWGQGVRLQWQQQREEAALLDAAIEANLRGLRF